MRGRPPNTMYMTRRRAQVLAALASADQVPAVSVSSSDLSREGRPKGRPAIRRTQVLEYVRASIAADGQSPSYAMICAAVGIQTRQEVSRIVQAAERDGLLERVGRGKERRIRLSN